MSSDDRDLIRRLLEEPAEPEVPAATPREPQAAPPPIEVKGATFLVHDDWDQRGGRAAATRAAGAAGAARRWGIARTGPAARYLGRLALTAVAMVSGLAGAFVGLYRALTDPLADARLYYDAAARLNEGLALYPAGAVAAATVPAATVPVPPVLAIVLRPLALLPYAAFAVVWEALVIGALVLLLRHLGQRSPRTWVAVGLLGIPLGWALSVGQVQVPIALLLALGQPWSLGFATNLAPYSALAALWWIGRRDHQAAGAFVLWTAIVAVPTFLLEPSGASGFLGSLWPSQVALPGNVSPATISPLLWAALLAVGCGLALIAARSRWGWPIAVVLATLASPRLLIHALSGLIAALREPVQANLPEPEPRPWLMVSGSGRH